MDKSLLKAFSNIVQKEVEPPNLYCRSATSDIFPTSKLKTVSFRFKRAEDVGQNFRLFFELEGHKEKLQKETLTIEDEITKADLKITFHARVLGKSPRARVNLNAQVN